MVPASACMAELLLSIFSTLMASYFLCSVTRSYIELSSSVLHVYYNTSPFVMGFWYTSLAIGLVATREHLASSATPFQTLPGGPQKLRLNPSFSQFSPCLTRCTVWPSVCRFYSYCYLPVPLDQAVFLVVLNITYNEQQNRSNN